MKKLKQNKMDIVGAFQRQLSRDLDWFERRDSLLETLEIIYKFRDSAITDDNTSVFAHSLIDRGLADTRALAIAEKLEMPNLTIYQMKEALTPILACDSSNFPKLIKLEPRLIYLCLKYTGDRALIERLEGVLYD